MSSSYIGHLLFPNHSLKNGILVLWSCENIISIICTKVFQVKRILKLFSHTQSTKQQSFPQCPPKKLSTLFFSFFGWRKFSTFCGKLVENFLFRCEYLICPHPFFPLFIRVWPAVKSLDIFIHIFTPLWKLSSCYVNKLFISTFLSHGYPCTIHNFSRVFPSFFSLWKTNLSLLNKWF